METAQFIYLIDDHKLFCEGLKAILESYPSVSKVRIFHNPEELIYQLNFEKPNLLITDISMPAMNGLTLIEKVRQAAPEISILVLSMHSQATYIKNAFKAGADGYLSKNARSDELSEALSQLGQQKQYISGQLAGGLMGKRRGQTEDLSEREMEVLLLISEGLNSSEMAERLFLSSHTIETHRKSLLKKSGASNSVQLVVWGIREGYIPIDTA